MSAGSVMVAACSLRNVRDTCGQAVIMT
jgi:hypothetical protein